MVSSLGLGLKSTEEELALTFWDTNSYLPSPPPPPPPGGESEMTNWLCPL